MHLEISSGADDGDVHAYIYKKTSPMHLPPKAPTMQLTTTPLLFLFSLARASPFRVDQRHSVPIQRCGSQTYAANEVSPVPSHLTSPPAETQYPVRLLCGAGISALPDGDAAVSAWRELGRVRLLLADGVRVRTRDLRPEKTRAQLTALQRCDNATLVLISGAANPSPSPTAAPPSASAPVSVSASATPVPISSAVSSYAPEVSSPTAGPSEVVVVIPLPVLSSVAVPAPVSSAMSSAAVPSASAVVPSSDSSPGPSVADVAGSVAAVASSMAEADHD